MNIPYKRACMLGTTLDILASGVLIFRGGIRRHPEGYQRDMMRMSLRCGTVQASLQVPANGIYRTLWRSRNTW